MFLVRVAQFRSGSLTCASAALLCLWVPPLQGQVESEPRSLVSPVADSVDEGGGWHGLWGRPEPDRLYGGLWALHLRRPEDGLSAHHLIGVSWRGFVLGTFVNTHEGRSWVAGIGRSVATAKGRSGALRLGYRLGLLAGYDERLMDMADRYPVIPAFQLLGDGRYGPVGIQVGWTWIVLYFGGFISLDILSD